MYHPTDKGHLRKVVNVKIASVDVLTKLKIKKEKKEEKKKREEERRQKEEELQLKRDAVTAG